MARILVVDDDRGTCKLVERVLGWDGHDVKSVFTGPEALSAARSFVPELILLDIMLPGMTGYEVERELGTSDLSHIPVVYLTGLLHEVEAALLGRKLGGRPVLTKPVRTTAMLECVEAQLRKGAPT